MKLKSKKTIKLPIIIAIVISIVLLLAIVGAVLIFSDQEEKHNPQDIESISLKSTPSKTIYYVGEEFDPTGISVRIGTYDFSYSYLVDHTSLTFVGFDSSVANDAQVITVTYRGFTTTFTVQILEKPSAPPMLSDIEIVGFKTDYTMSEWNAKGPQVTGAIVKLIYDDGTIDESVLLQKAWVYGAVKVQEPCTLDLTIKYNNNGKVFEKVVTITITN